MVGGGRVEGEIVGYWQQEGNKTAWKPLYLTFKVITSWYTCCYKLHCWYIHHKPIASGSDANLNRTLTFMNLDGCTRKFCITCDKNTVEIQLQYFLECIASWRRNMGEYAKGMGWHSYYASKFDSVTLKWNLRQKWEGYNYKVLWWFGPFSETTFWLAPLPWTTHVVGSLYFILSGSKQEQSPSDSEQALAEAIENWHREPTSNVASSKDKEYILCSWKDVLWGSLIPLNCKNKYNHEWKILYCEHP